jgi:DNA-binding NtrC family response regulator
MTKKKILVVDDEKPIRIGCEAILVKEGYDVRIAESGEEAMQLLKESRYDLVITDLQMYDIDGVKLFKHVCANYPGTGMIMMTGYGSTDTALKALKQGTYDYITKPVDLTALCSLVKQCLEKKESTN